MNLRPSNKDTIRLDITPLIDVVFLLLIFFMVSTTFKHDSEIRIKLPEATEQPKTPKVDTIDVTIDKKGTVYIGSLSLPYMQKEDLKDMLSEAAAGLDTPAIIINADADTTHQAVITVMDVARQLTLTKISFTTQQDAAE